jgi:hypothetical protein
VSTLSGSATFGRWLAAAAFCALAGCTMQTFHLQHADDMDQSGVIQREDTQNFFIGGLGQELSVNAAAACAAKERVVSVETYRSLVNVLLSFASFGLYTPAQAVVRCR